MTLRFNKPPAALDYYRPPPEPEPPGPEQRRDARRRLLGACVACAVASVPLLIALLLIYLTARGKVR